MPGENGSAASRLLRGIKSEGVDHAFLVPGGSIDLFMPHFGAAGVEPVTATHEAGAAYMADGYGRARNGFGVCMGISGPGVTNMLTALGTASSDQTAVLLLTGSLPFALRGRNAFQDATPSGISDLELVRPVTTFAQEIVDAARAESQLHQAVTAMTRGARQGPAFLTVPEDLQTSEDQAQPYRPVTTEPRPRPLDVTAATLAAELIDSGAHIAIYAGNGCVRSGASADLLRLAETYGIPVASTLRAKGVFPEDHPLSLGVFGMGGHSRARDFLQREDVDVLLVVGVNLNEYNTFWSADLQPRRGIVRIDTNPAAQNPDGYHGITVTGDAGAALSWLAADPATQQHLAGTRAARTTWCSEVFGLPRHDQQEARESASRPLHPAHVVTVARDASPRDVNLVCDSGAHTFFASNHWDCPEPGRWFVATTLGPMGWALGAAVGVRLADPGHPCLVITGDGCMLMHGMEIATAVRHHLPIVYLVLNNGVLGSVYLRLKKIDVASAGPTVLPVVDWAAHARALGADGTVVETSTELEAALARAYAHDGPFVIDVRCDPDAETP